MARPDGAAVVGGLPELSNGRMPVASLRTIPDHVAKRRKTWAWSASMHQSASVWLSTIAVLAGVVAAAFGDVLGMSATRALGFLAAACAGILGTVRPGVMGTRLRNAWRTLDDACVRYEDTPDFTEAELYDAMAHGERMIGDLDG